MMASTGDDGSSTDSVPDELFKRSSSAVAGAEEDVQYAQDPRDDAEEAPEHFPHRLSDGNQNDQDDDANEAESDQDSSDEDYDRENRFEGPASTWRFYAEAERGLAASLDQERANDLSRHLYNAHALKVEVRDSGAVSQTKHHHGKKHWIKANDDGTLPWHPDAFWTAWPMKPEHVPRKGEAFGVAVTSREDEKATYRKPESWKPSADLEGEIQAIMMRKAKEKLRERERQRLASMVSLSLRTAGELSPRKRKRSSSPSSSSGSSSDTEGEEQRLSHSDRRDSTAREPKQSFDILEDDEEAATILQPSFQHIISKLDDLLLGLQKSRKGHMREPPSPRSRARYERRKSKSRSRRQSRARTENEEVHGISDANANDKIESRSRSRASSEAAGSADPGDAEDANSAALEGKKKPKRKPPLNPRDWSEVLGMAPLVGWDPAVVRRAADRCSLLFGESMAFAELGKRPMAEDGANAQAGNGFIVEEEEEVEGYCCPVESCLRHTQPWPLKMTYRWREHLKRVHKYSKEQIEGLEAELKANRVAKASSSAGNGVEASRHGQGEEDEVEAQGH